VCESPLRLLNPPDLNFETNTVFCPKFMKVKTMSHNVQSASRLSLNPVALSSFSVAICSFGAAVLGLPFSHWPSAGLAGVGVFYLVVGLISWATSTSAVHETGTETSHKTAGADNLVAEAVGKARETVAPARSSPELVGAQH
jgi:hypothetical protein